MRGKDYQTARSCVIGLFPRGAPDAMLGVDEERVMAMAPTTADDGRLGLRPEIARAWRRAELCGLDPGSDPTEPDLAEVDRDSRLVSAARPVLDDLESQLADSRFSLLLADRDSRIVERRCGRRELRTSLDGVLAMPGNRYSEETTGTNALASAYEVGTGIAVHGQEHFLERLKAFTCYGRRITNPFTGHLEGVLDVTGYVGDSSPLLSTVVGWAAREIERRLVAGAGTRQEAMVRAYQQRAGNSRRPVVVFGDDMLLLNAAASALLDGPTQVRLRELAEHASARGGGTGRVRLPTGSEAAFACHAVDGAPGAALVELLDPAPARSPVPRRHDETEPLRPLLTRIRTARDRVLITGEPGTGRTHTAMLLADDVVVLEPDDVAAHTTATLRRTFAEHRGLLVVEDVHLLAPGDAARVRDALDAHPASWVALTGAPLARLDDEQRTLAARCAETVELLPLRHRRDDLPRLARAILRDLDPEHPCVPTPAADSALVRYSWPGNLPELVSVLHRAAGRRPGSDLLAADLGLEHRPGVVAGRGRSLLEESEAETIRGALRRSEGNKTRAAAELGISRTTMWRRVRELGLE
jgi:sigma-54 dependent transcriptional regulator, acetoin dehydrogenase operon transcriptional activator AcoR